METHQVLVSALPGEIVTNCALDLQGHLRALGPSEIFAQHVDPYLADRVRRIEDYVSHSRPGGADLLVYHASIGEPMLTAFLCQRSEPVALILHHASPTRDGAPDETASSPFLGLSREPLDQLVGRVALAVAGSELEAGGLRAAGFRRVVVSPPVVDVDALRAIPSDPAMAAYLACFDGPVVLFVGELHPDERPDWLLAAYYILVTYLEPLVHFVLVGVGGRTPYRRALDTFVAEVNLSRAHMVGSVGKEALAACYRTAEVFVTASEHRGCSIPVLEAMAFDVPVLARGVAGESDSLGRAGLLLRPDHGPSVAAEAMALLIGEQTARATVANEGRRVLQSLNPSMVRANLVAQLRSAVD
ncbi:MAG TPA: glycosyltransferase family 4 protein [Acidimicrobiales bacterium]|jgi:glycosyltransferase involved in cell wall biosynthesis